jgi:hypothetical protein
MLLRLGRLEVFGGVLLVEDIDLFGRVLILRARAFWVQRLHLGFL